MHEKNIALLCDEADRLLQLNINLLRQMVDEPDVLLVRITVKEIGE
ncbi:hypothetical protein QRV66_004490 [Escherichia coli]|nr:hypothetical protein [Escherichia coli]